MDKFSDQDRLFMRQALKLAAKGAGSVSPNPLVGALLVREGRVIGQGYHQKFGQAHAEVNAIAEAGGNASGATLFCTLEPCCHTNKKTPPCAQRIISEKIVRVVIAATDPNPQVNGKGVAMLRAAGIEVQTGLLAHESLELNRFYYKFVRHGMPWVMIKIAQTLDGRISEGVDRQTWISGEKTQREVHKWRAQYDAVLVGAGTVRTDNPQLNIRHFPGRNPKRIILSHSLDFSLDTNILSPENRGDTLIFTTSNEKAAKFVRLKNDGVHVRQIATGTEGLIQVLRMLAADGIASIMAEGGQEIFSAFVSSALADEICIFVSPKIFASGPGAFDSRAAGALGSYVLHRIKKLEPDVLITYRHRGHTG